MKKDVSALSVEAQRSEIQKRTEMLIRVRDRSECELKDRLARVGFDETIVEKEVTRARVAGLVDNERFTNLYVSGKKRSGWGQGRIENELQRFGIDLRQHEGYPEQFFGSEEELERALSCLARFKTTAKDKRSACYRKLISKGFSTEIINQAIALHQ
jgi:regulatory protein